MNVSRSAIARRAAVAILFSCTAALPYTVLAQQNNPFAGNWKFVPERSSVQGGQVPYKSATITFPDPTVMNIEGVDAGGKPLKGTYQAVIDGKAHPVTGISNIDTGMWTKNSDTNTSYRYMKGKNIVALGSRVLSADGSTITFRQQQYDARGRPAGSAVLVFQNPDVQVATVMPAAGGQVIMQSALTADETAGSAAMQKDDSDGMIAAFTRALEKKEKGSNPVYDHVMRGIAYAKKAQYEQALADFDEALKIKPDDVDARFRRGATRNQLKNYQGAIEDLTVVINADAMNAAALRLRGFAYNTLGDDKKAGADYDKACAINKEYCL